jgi:uncharacterized repeat protein (TIGR02543 family)
VRYERGSTADGGTAPAATEHLKHSTAVLSGNTGNLYKIGKDFAGWSKSPDGSTMEYPMANGNQIENIEADVTLYPAWSGGPDLYVTVTYVANLPAGSRLAAGVSMPSPTTHLKHSDADLASGAALAAVGYDFLGWSLDPTDRTHLITSIAQIVEDTEVYAIWSSEPLYVTLTYDRNDPNATAYKSGTVPAAVEYLKNETVTLAGNTGNLVMLGYNFDGWGATASATTALTQIDITEDTTVYAIWEGDDNGDPIEVTLKYIRTDPNATA